MEISFEKADFHVQIIKKLAQPPCGKLGKLFIWLYSKHRWMPSFIA
jgi:hypothetical protein